MVEFPQGIAIRVPVQCLHRIVKAEPPVLGVLTRNLEVGLRAAHAECTLGNDQDVRAPSKVTGHIDHRDRGYRVELYELGVLRYPSLLSCLPAGRVKR